MRITTIIASAIAGGIVVAACGDDTEPLTKAEFVEQADAICAETMEQITPIFEAVWSDVDMADENTPDGQHLVFVRFDEAVDEAMPFVDQQIAEIRELEPPAADKELIETLLDDQEAAFDEFAVLMDAAAGGDESAMATLERDDPTDDIDRRAREYGLEVCGQDDEA